MNTIEIIRIVDTLPDKATGMNKPSKWVGVADHLPATGQWAIITGCKGSETAIARKHGIELRTRAKVTYARRLAA